MDGTGKFRAGDADGERIFFDGTNAIVSASSFLMGNNTSFVSGSNGNMLRLVVQVLIYKHLRLFLEI